jgi:cytochrome c556
MAFGAAATGLAAVAGDGLDPMRAAFGPVGAACGACHDAYQAEQ